MTSSTDRSLEPVGRRARARRDDTRPGSHVGGTTPAPPEEAVSRVDFPEVFAAALAGVPCVVTGMDGAERLLPMARWDADANSSDDALLGLCEGTTLDVGCGPGRLTSRLAELGHVVLGVDIVGAAVRRTRARGVSAVQRDLFERLPGEGRWQSVLLADGNVGIGGDPRRLLRRMSELVAPGGRVVVETARPGGGLRVHHARLRCGSLESHSFDWAVLPADGVEHQVHDLPLSLDGIHRIGAASDERWTVVLRREESP